MAQPQSLREDFAASTQLWAAEVKLWQMDGFSEVISGNYEKYNPSLHHLY
jgi:hypothetical protein